MFKPNSYYKKPYYKQNSHYPQKKRYNDDYTSQTKEPTPLIEKTKTSIKILKSQPSLEQKTFTTQ
jgi:hypothetical protein